MDLKYGSMWQHVGAFRTPTFTEPLQDLFFSARSWRGGLAGRAVTHPSTLLRREELLMKEDKAMEEDGDSDSTGDSDLGSLLGSIL